MKNYDQIHRAETLNKLREILDNIAVEFTHDNNKFLELAYQAADNRDLDKFGLYLWEACKREAEFITEERIESIEIAERNHQAEQRQVTGPDLLTTIEEIVLGRQP